MNAKLIRASLLVGIWIFSGTNGFSENLNDILNQIGSDLEAKKESPRPTPGRPTKDSAEDVALKPPPAGISKKTAPLNHATKESPYVNSLGMKFVPVPGTNVLFSVWDTRVKDFAIFAEATGYRHTGGIIAWDGAKWGWDAGASWERPGFVQTAFHPVVGVSWDEAKAFCQWLTAIERREGKITASQAYRLPTDAEWSAAVGFAKYPWGNEWPPPKGAGNYDPSLGVDSYANTSPCGNLEANRLGLSDMGGNVWQWCEDWYRASMNESALLEKYPFLKDDAGGRKYKVVRGGSWFSGSPGILWASHRGYENPGDRDSRFGFRCVLGSSR